jgi:hypothetical protein
VPLDITCPEYTLNPVIPWKSPLMELAMMSTKIGSLHKILFLLGVLSTCLALMLCVLLADALVLLDWLAVLCFFELHFPSPYYPVPGPVGLLLQLDAALHCQDQ